jgi:23S rRNA pseudouridine1911/1915/1917 synthase
MVPIKKGNLPFMPPKHLVLIVPDADAGKRLVTWLIRQIRTLSRAQIQRLIHEGRILIGGHTARDDRPIHSGDKIELDLPPPQATALKPQPFALDILHEDADILIVNKPPGLLMHPATGHPDKTLANALIQRFPDLIINNEIRPGLVHRLDRDTSGVLVVAKNARALTILARQFKRRTITKEYLALVLGRPDPPEGSIDNPIGPDPGNSHRMSVDPPTGGKSALTHYVILKTRGDQSLLRVIPETGRRHQIRVHLAYRGHPVVGDRDYGEVAEKDLSPARQMLHAYRIRFRHPGTNVMCEFTAPLPADFLLL